MHGPAPDVLANGTSGIALQQAPTVLAHSILLPATPARRVTARSRRAEAPGGDPQALPRPTPGPAAPPAPTASDYAERRRRASTSPPPTSTRPASAEIQTIGELSASPVRGRPAGAGEAAGRGA